MSVCMHHCVVDSLPIYPVTTFKTLQSPIVLVQVQSLLYTCSTNLLSIFLVFTKACSEGLEQYNSDLGSILYLTFYIVR